MDSPAALDVHDLDDGCELWLGSLPEELVPSEAEFDALWALHPAEYQEIHLVGRRVATPRWQQAYGADYRFSGQVNRALPVPAMLEPHLAWAREHVDSRLNGLLVIWYDAELGHYIGKHRDSTKHMHVGAPIVTVSFGAERTFRLRPWKRDGPFVDFRTFDGRVIVMPYETNLAWTHEITKRAADSGRRISLTIRAFEDGVLDGGGSGGVDGGAAGSGSV